MSSNWKIIASLFSLCILASVWSVGFIRFNNSVCEDIEVVFIDEARESGFLETEDIKKVISEKLGYLPEGKTFGALSIADIEEAISHIPEVKNAEVSITENRKVKIEMEMRNALGLVFPVTDVPFYIDQYGVKIPVSKTFTPDVPLVSGRIWEKAKSGDTVSDLRVKALIPVLEFIYKNSFFNAQVSELVLNDKGEVSLYPEIGEVKIIFGKPDSIENKFSKILLFYKKVLQNVGWDAYSFINVTYAGQIIAERKDNLNVEVPLENKTETEKSEE